MASTTDLTHLMRFSYPGCLPVTPWSTLPEPLLSQARAQILQKVHDLAKSWDVANDRVSTMNLLGSVVEVDGHKIQVLLQTF
jgi:hypothetical protein